MIAADLNDSDNTIRQSPMITYLINAPIPRWHDVFGG